MRQHEQAMLLVKKAADDEALLAEILSSTHVSDEILGFHCQQAAEKLLKALLSQAGIGYPEPITCACSWTFWQIPDKRFLLTWPSSTYSLLTAPCFATKNCLPRSNSIVKRFSNWSGHSASLSSKDSQPVDFPC